MPQLTAAMEQHWFGQTLSIYGEPLEDCRGSDTFADFPAGSGDAGSRCSSRWLDMGLHQVCIPELPANFSTATGQGSWSRSFAGRPWCICVWAYSSYSSQMLPALPLNCAAIPQQVLAPAHAVAAFRRCGRGGLACQPEIAVQSVQKLCSTCLQQAPRSGQVAEPCCRRKLALAIDVVADGTRLLRADDVPRVCTFVAVAVSIDTADSSDLGRSFLATSRRGRFCIVARHFPGPAPSRQVGWCSP
eukprot:gnl/TRDRNA2_/TRDRNA2_82255_c0_seq1.p1 gnl/TRDRNA2_/TRDRNA2_82255_c0~~gnl/TRDRNA2_/TRDRNA2_82255_c0_seq1.p1  ORF type:complete len:279 (-),score=22.29 gnl/TRDRNA2_/TRDRNA2_82255_c0_seq1:390-1124(-)